MANIALYIYIEQRAEHRQQHNEHQPGDLPRRVNGPVDEIHHQHSRQQHRNRQIMGKEILKPPGDDNDKYDLHRQQQQNDAYMAEDRDALAAAVQECQAVILFFLCFHRRTPPFRLAFRSFRHFLLF